MEKDQKYQEFIKNWAQIFNKSFLIFVALLATVFINLYTNKLDISISNTFDKLITFAFALYVFASLLWSILTASVIYFFLVYVMGSIVFIVNKLYFKIYKKYGLIPILITSLILLGLGIYTVIFKFKGDSFSWGNVLGLTSFLFGLIPYFNIIINRIKGKESIPYYIG